MHLPARFPVIAGPTAGGKTALALALARRWSAQGIQPEIISADAFIVFRGMDIGTAKPTQAERTEFPHHLVDVADPREGFSVHQWLRLAQAAVDEIRARGRTPIVVGGTHLYIKSFMEGLFEGPPPDPALRARLASTPTHELRARLERVDPEASARIHPEDVRRTIRALEVFEQTGRPISTLQTQWDRTRRSDAVLVALAWPTPALNSRINARVKQMIHDGLVDEVRSLDDRGVLGTQAREALGYKQILGFLRGTSSLDDAIESVKIQTRRFAKNQRTWLRRLNAEIVLESEREPMESMVSRVLDACANPREPA